MFKIVFTSVAVLLGVIFAIQNSEQVDFHLLLGGPLKVRLIFLVLTAFAAGYVTAYLLRIHREVSLKRQIRHVVNGKPAGATAVPNVPVQRALEPGFVDIRRGRAVGLENQEF